MRSLIELGEVSEIVIPNFSIFNPSIFNDDGTLYTTLRDHVNGINTNFIAKINYDLTLHSYNTIILNENLNNLPPGRSFSGTEDFRLFKWNDKFYISGTCHILHEHVLEPLYENEHFGGTHVGKIELSQIEINEYGINEVTRLRIRNPENNRFMEKNWMPVLDMPFYFVRWCNPFELLKINPESDVPEVVLRKDYVEELKDYRGSSQIIPFEENRIAVLHEKETRIEDGNKPYLHKIVIWDKDWNIVKVSDSFTFFGERIEFCAGITEHEGSFIISFGVDDKRSYLLKISKDNLKSFIFN